MSVYRIGNKSSESPFPKIRPTLDLDFANSKTLDPRITFRRASGGSYVGPDGRLRYAGVNEPRFTHDPLTGECLGLLVEEQRTNLLLRSEEFGASPWASASPYSVLANTAIAPDGTQSADSIVVGTGVSSFNVNVTKQVVSKSASAIQYTRSIYAKALGATTSFRFSDHGSSTTDNVSCVVSLINGSIITSPTTAGGFSSASVVVSPAGDGWYRVALTYTTDASTALIIRSFPYVGLNPLAGDGASGLLVWGAQLEAGAFPTSYIPTTASAATRSADVASISGSNFSSWYWQDEGTVFADAITTMKYGGSNAFPRIFNISDGGNSNNVELYYRVLSSYTDAGYAVANGGVTQAVFDTVSESNGFKLAAAVMNNNFSFSTNGVLRSTDTSGAMPTVSQADIGKRPTGTSSFTGTIRRLTYFPQRLPNSTLQSITR